MKEENEYIHDIETKKDRWTFSVTTSIQNKKRLERASKHLKIPFNTLVALVVEYSLQKETVKAISYAATINKKVPNE